jgi:hypothetical protein
MGYKLSWALGEALIKNQLEDGMQETWLKMAAGEPTLPIEGTPKDGVRGAMFMPPSEERRGEPAIDVIAEALRRYAVGVEDHQDRRRRFRAFLRQLGDLHGGNDDLRHELVGAADAAKWARWCVECLPMWHERKVKPGLTEITAWLHVATCMGVKHTKGLCGGTIRVVGLNDSQLEYARGLSQTFELLQSRNNYPSDRSMDAVAIHAMTEIEERLSIADPVRALTVARVRNRLLKRQNIHVTVVDAKLSRKRHIDAALQGTFRVGSSVSHTRADQRGYRSDPLPDSVSIVLEANGHGMVSAGEVSEQFTIRVPKDIQRCTVAAVSKYVGKALEGIGA